MVTLRRKLGAHSVTLRRQLGAPTLRKNMKVCPLSISRKRENPHLKVKAKMKQEQHVGDLSNPSLLRALRTLILQMVLFLVLYFRRQLGSLPFVVFGW